MATIIGSDGNSYSLFNSKIYTEKGWKPAGAQIHKENLTEELSAQDSLITQIQEALKDTVAGTAEAFAAISVTYPEGSTCICSNKLPLEMILIDTVVGEATWIGSKVNIPCLAGSLYTVESPSMTVGSNKGHIYFYDSNGGLCPEKVHFGEESNSVTFVAPEGAISLYIEINVSDLPEEEQLFTDITLLCGTSEKLFTAPNTSGQVLFLIPEVGTWTVSCTDDTEATNETVRITTEGQSVNVELRYKTYIYEKGIGPEDTWFNGGASSWIETILYDDEGIAFSSDGSPNFFADTKIDLTDIDILYFDMSTETKDNVECIVHDKQVPYTTSVFVAEAMSTGGLTSLDVSALQGEYYYGFEIIGGSSSKSNPFYCYNIYY